MDRNRLENAASGKTRSNGGLNVSEIKVYLTTQGLHFNVNANRETLENILRNSLFATQGMRSPRHTASPMATHSERFTPINESSRRSSRSGQGHDSVPTTPSPFPSQYGEQIYQDDEDVLNEVMKLSLEQHLEQTRLKNEEWSRAKLIREQMLREQDEAYNESLRIDRQKDEKRRQQQKQLQERELLQQRQRQEKERRDNMSLKQRREMLAGPLMKKKPVTGTTFQELEKMKTMANKNIKQQLQQAEKKRQQQAQEKERRLRQMREARLKALTR
jgi:hypothetical protein